MEFILISPTLTGNLAFPTVTSILPYNPGPSSLCGFRSGWINRVLFKELYSYLTVSLDDHVLWIYNLLFLWFHSIFTWSFRSNSFYQGSHFVSFEVGGKLSPLHSIILLVYFQNVLSDFEPLNGVRQVPAFRYKHWNDQFFCLISSRGQLESHFNPSQVRHFGYKLLQKL